MNLVNSDPFRTQALPVTTGKNDIDKSISTAVTCAEIGNAGPSDIDFSILLPAETTGAEIEDAKKLMRANGNIFPASLFWFSKNNPTDELALAAIKEGDTEKAITTWENVIYQKD